MKTTPTAFSRRSLVAAALAAPVAFTASGPARAQDGAYPSKQVRIVVPFPAGGYSDTLARVIATSLGNTFGQAVVVDNRPGAGGNIGADMVVKSAPDGYNLVMGTIGTQVVNPLIYQHMPYDATKDFAPVAFVADAETVLVVNSDVPVHSVAELLALAKKKPGELTFASGGAGTTSQLAGELFKTATGISITHVPYKGNVPALTDLVAGQVTMSFATLQPALPFIKNGKLTALATLGASRASTLQNIPTLREQGLRDFEVRNWTGLLAPAGTPAAVTHRLAMEVDKIMQSATVQNMLAAQGLVYTRMGPEAFDRFIHAENTKWTQVVRQADIKID